MRAKVDMRKATCTPPKFDCTAHINRPSPDFEKIFVGKGDRLKMAVDEGIFM